MVRTLKGSPFQTFAEFFDQNGVRAQRYRIDAGRQTVLVGDKGTRLTLPAFSLLDISGRIVSGEVEVRLTEIFSRSEMVLSNMVSTSEDRLLESGGQILVQAIQDHQMLELRQPIRVELPVSPALNNPLAMRLFEGGTAKTRAFRSARSFDWKQVSRRTIPVVKIGKYKYFRFLLQKFRWINCDYFCAKRSNRTMVTAHYHCEEEVLDDMAAFLVFHEFNAVARMYPAGNRFSSFNIPTGQSATVLLLGLKAGQLYLGATRIDRTSNQLLGVEMYAVEEPEMLKVINSL